MKKLLTLIFAALMTLSMSMAAVSYAVPQEEKKAEGETTKKKGKKGKKGKKEATEEKKEEKK
jgi:ribosomal protein L12E/L44/L45/RPP1/RPP2